MAIYYTSSSAAGGGVGSYVDPWTLQEAFDSAVAGDEVRILNDGVYYLTSSIDIDTNSGTSSSHISYRGRSSDDTSYELVTIDGSSLGATAPIFDLESYPASFGYLDFFDLKLQNATYDPIRTFYNRCYECFWSRCIIDGGRYCFFTNNSRVYRCEVLNCTVGVFGVRNTRIIECFIHDNAVGISNCEQDTLFFGCLFINHSRASQQFSGTVNFLNCTFDNNTEVMSYLKSKFVINCVFSNSSSFGISLDPTQYFSNMLFIGNYFYNNTVNISGSSLTYEQSLLNTLDGSNPLYVSTAAGSEDYNISSDSPLLGRGLPRSIPYSSYKDMITYTTVGALSPRLVNQVFHPLGPGGT